MPTRHFVGDDFRRDTNSISGRGSRLIFVLHFELTKVSLYDKKRNRKLNDLTLFENLLSNALQEK